MGFFLSCLKERVHKFETLRGRLFLPVATGANIDFMCCGWLETFESLVISDSHVGQVADINYSYTFEGIQAFI